MAEAKLFFGVMDEAKLTVKMELEQTKQDLNSMS